MKIIVGLGNPGDRYRGGRHNIGFRCVDSMARQWGIRISDRRAKAVLGRGHHQGQEVVLAKPRTFMNNSGEGVAYLLTRFGGGPADLIIIYDEMDLPVGKLRLRPEGSTAGHNGMRSIVSALNSTAFPRIRVGIGHPETKGDRVISHVLTGFSKEEEPLMVDAVARVVQTVDCILEESIGVAMNRFN